MKKGKNKLPSVLVGCPTSDYKEYCLDEYAKAIKNLTYKNYNILLVDNSKTNSYFKKLKAKKLPVERGSWFEGARDRVVTSRNILRQRVLDQGYDYLFSLEQDVIPPPDVLERLLSHKKKIISGIYFTNHEMSDGQVALAPLVYILTDKQTKSMRILDHDEIWKQQPKPLRIVSCGMGCVLIHRSILEKIKFRYDKKTRSHDDRWFGWDVYENKFSMWCDNAIKCKHLIKGRPWRWKDLKY